MRKKRKLRARAEAAAEAERLAAEGHPPDHPLPPEGGGPGRGEDPSSQDTAETPTGDRLESIIESLLFVADAPLSVHRMRALTHAGSNKEVQAAVDTLLERYSDRGINLYKVGGGYQFRSHSKNATWVQKLVAGKPVRLTRAQLETLAIIAYRQPITRPEIDDIRGVDSGGTLRLLLERELIRILGKKEEPGRPILYGTTPGFLDFFNLDDLRELPTLTEYSELTDESLEEVERLSPEDVREEGESGSESATDFEAAADSESGSASASDSASESGSASESDSASEPGVEASSGTGTGTGTGTGEGAGDDETRVA